jgi:sporulation protein YlmC with PRC-barrel domain
MEKITDILRTKVFSEDGQYLGRVFDLRSRGELEHGSNTEERVVTEIIYGMEGLLEELGLRKTVEQRVAWESVKSLDNKTLVVNTNTSSPV